MLVEIQDQTLKMYSSLSIITLGIYNRKKYSDCLSFRKQKFINNN